MQTGRIGLRSGYRHKQHNRKAAQRAAPKASCRAPRRRGVHGCYLALAVVSSVETFVKVPVSSVPTALRAVMTATAISAAIRPYSMAVAPDSSLAKRLKRVFIACSFWLFPIGRGLRDRTLFPIGRGLPDRTTPRIEAPCFQSLCRMLRVLQVEKR